MQNEPVVSDELRAPFPWFGGKRRAAEIVWDRLGNVDTYNEPFFGSGAVLLARPHAPRVETINDVDSMVANFWRALQHDPDGVAYWADAPVNEADLHSRHRWLVSRGRRLALRCSRDPHYFNAKVAGWWVWGQCLWIGSGWCQTPEWTGRANVGRKARGIHAQRTMATRSGENPSEQFKRPASSRSGTSVGVHGKRFASTGNGQGAGVHRRWQGGGQGGGSGVHAPTLSQQVPLLRASASASASGQGVNATGRTAGLYAYMEQLAARMRRVRVCCGDWKRVLTPSVTTYIGTCGVFLDPPYSHDLRERCYSEDHDISADVRAWAIEHGNDPNMRIALCGYDGEHNNPDLPNPIPASWECVPWKAHGGYSRSERGVANRERERIWFSPHCQKPKLF
jgi:DNA adenine methylase